MEYQISNEHISLTVSALGAEMQSIRRGGLEYLWNGDETYWAERAPVLFPYVGRFTDGKYLLNGREHHMDIHGFARKLLYKVTGQTEESITFELGDNESTYEEYPFHFILRVTYTLRENEIQITYSVHNRSDETMYFGIGGHPGFRVPLEEGLDFSDYYLEFGGAARPERIGHTETCFLSGVNREFPLEDGRKIPLSHDMFDEDAIVLYNMADRVTLKSDRGHRQVKVSYKDMPYLGLWHAPKTEAPYICIEPWTSLPSRQDIVEELRYKGDLIRLSSGLEYRNQWSVKVT